MCRSLNSSFRAALDGEHPLVFLAGQLEHEASPAPSAWFTANPPGVAFRDLSNEGQPQPDAALGAGLAWGSIEGLEDPFPLRFWNARPAVGDHESDSARLLAGGDLHLDRDFTMAQRVLEQVSNEPSQQPRIALHGTADAVDIDAFESSRFFGREREQVDRFSFVCLIRRVESTRHEQLSDQVVEFLDVAVDASEKVRPRVVVEERDRHTHARERCA